ncbi:unnamed protein product, partial [Rhizophagus irregularis]
LETKLDFKDAY